MSCAVPTTDAPESARSISDLSRRQRRPRTGHNHSNRESARVLERRLPRASGGAANPGRSGYKFVAGKADVQLAESSRRMKIYTGCALL